MNLLHYIIQVIFPIPLWIMLLELAKITDPPNMITNSISFRVTIIHFFSGDFLAYFNGFFHGTIGKPSSTSIIHFSSPRILVKMPKHIDQIVAMNIISYLFSFVTKNGVMFPRNRTFHKVRQKAVQFSPGMVGPGEAASPEYTCFHPVPELNEALSGRGSGVTPKEIGSPSKSVADKVRCRAFPRCTL